MLKSKSYLFLTICISIYSFSSQAQQFDWVNGYENDSYKVHDLDIDSKDNLIVLGAVDGTMNLGSSGSTTVGSGTRATVVQKVDSNGTLEWGWSLDGNYNSPLDLQLSATSHSYILGQFHDNLDFDPSSSGTFILNDSGSIYPDIYLMQINEDGSFGWAKRWTNNSQQDYYTSMTLTPDEHIGVFAMYDDSVDVDPSGGITTYHTSNTYGAFVSVLDSIGDFAWSADIASSQSTFAYDIFSDQENNIYLHGTCGSNLTITGSELSSANVTNTVSGTFLIKFTSDGQVDWVHNAAGSIRSYQAFVNSNGDIFLSGIFGGTVDFDFSSSGVQSYTSNATFDRFLLRLDSNGMFEKVVTISGESPYHATSVLQFDATGIYLGYGYQDSIDIDPGSGSTVIYDSLNSVLVETNEDFDLIDHVMLNPRYVRKVRVSSSGALYSSNSFCSTTDFDPGNDTFNLTPSVDSCNIFIHRMYPNKTVGVERFALNTQSLSIFPNPSSGYTQMILPDHVTMSQVEIFDVHGRMVYHNTRSGNRFDMFLSVEPGLYFVRAKDQNGALYSGRVIKQ